MQYDAQRLNIEFLEPEFNKVFLYTRPMHPSEWSSILFNFYTNAKKAIAREKIEGKILIECGEDNGNIFLEFSDNGDGIKEGMKSLYLMNFLLLQQLFLWNDFEANNEVVGTGLGLKIVRDIVKSHRGRSRLFRLKASFALVLE